MVPAFLLPLSLRIAGLCVQQADSKQAAGSPHPMGAVLAAVVEIQTLRNAVLSNGLAQRILYYILLHVRVKLGVKNITGGVVNQTGKIGLRRNGMDEKNRSVFDVALPQVVPMFALETLGGVPFVLVGLH